MKDVYENATYGERIAGIYDDLFEEYEEAAVSTLSELARGGSALELGIGTGRIALPLVERGIAVSGIDASPSMVAKMRAKPGGAGVQVAEGNFADAGVEGSFSLIYVVFNTFFALPSQEEQVRCFRNVAARLAPGGAFLIEAFVPDVTRFSGNQTVRAVSNNTERTQLEISIHDPVKQRVNSQHVFLMEGGVKLYPVRIRYAWPSELDLMARLAGLRLRQRWAGWRREPFDARSDKHVSVYELDS